MTRSSTSLLFAATLLLWGGFRLVMDQLNEKPITRADTWIIFTFWLIGILHLIQAYRFRKRERLAKLQAHAKASVVQNS